MREFKKHVYGEGWKIDMSKNLGETTKEMVKKAAEKRQL